MGRAARRKKENAVYKKLVTNGVPPEFAQRYASGELQLLDQNLNPVGNDPDDVIKAMKESAASVDMAKLKKAMDNAF